MAQYSVEAKNVYNMDEKGFLIGMQHKARRVFPQASFGSGKKLGAGQDGNREWITCVACICQDGTYIPPGLIYPAVSGNIQDTWVEDFNPEDNLAFFASTPSGWTNDELGFSWLTTVFERYTKPKARNGRDWRVLFIDGHGSHINMRFLDWAIDHRILIAVYPPHSTHRLQPLDVSLFSPLSIYYDQELDKWRFSSLGFLGMTKREFYRLFIAAFKKAFTEKNILSGWKQTGLLPWDPKVVLNAIEPQRPQTGNSQSSSSSVYSAENIRKVRRVYKQVAGPNPSRDAQKLGDFIERLASENALLSAQNKGLRAAVVSEKKRRKRGKPLLQLIPSDNGSKAQFFSPHKITTAQSVRERSCDLGHVPYAYIEPSPSRLELVRDYP
jgi:hypothetical protein